MAEFEIERFDAIARDVCRCFADGYRIGVINELGKTKNPIENALVVAMASDRMTSGVRKSFIDFLTLQAMSLHETSRREAMPDKIEE